MGLKLHDRAVMRWQGKLRAMAIEEKKQQLKRADMMVVGMREMPREMLDEMVLNPEVTEKDEPCIQKSYQKSNLKIEI